MKCAIVLLGVGYKVGNCSIGCWIYIMWATVLLGVGYKVGNCSFGCCI